MAKTKPIGVRFDEGKLKEIQLNYGLKTAQAVVTFLIEKELAQPFAVPLRENAIKPLPKDYVKVKKVGILREGGTVESIKNVPRGQSATDKINQMLAEAKAKRNQNSK